MHLFCTQDNRVRFLVEAQSVVPLRKELVENDRLLDTITTLRSQPQIAMFA